MMVQRGHAEHALAEQPERGDLNNHGGRFEHEQAADDGEHEFVLGRDGDGAQRAAKDAGLTEQTTLIRVPGTFELPVAAASLAKDYDAIIALGVVIRGGTPHFDYVCLAATHGLTNVSVDTKTPVGFGVLTCDNEEQGLDRAGLENSSEDKGYEAYSAAVMTVAALA